MYHFDREGRVAGLWNVPTSKLPSCKKPLPRLEIPTFSTGNNMVSRGSG